MSLFCRWLARGIICLGVVAGVVGCSSTIRYARTASHVKREPVMHRAVSNASVRQPVYSAKADDRLSAVISSYLGTPYRYGGISRQGLDCSGFVHVVFKDVYHLSLPHTTRKLRRLGLKVALSSAQRGDLVFFSGGVWGRVNHVGIYLGEGLFAHASSSKGVTYSTLQDPYYKKHVVELRRVV